MSFNNTAYRLVLISNPANRVTIFVRPMSAKQKVCVGLWLFNQFRYVTDLCAQAVFAHPV
jgi:hypothetical protein